MDRFRVESCIALFVGSSGHFNCQHWHNMGCTAPDLFPDRVPPPCTAFADVLKAVSRGLLVRSLKDKVPAVVSSSLRALRALVGAAVAGKAAPRDLQAAVAELLPLLVEKAADLNQRTREQTTEALVALGGVPEVGLANTTGPFLRAIKPNTAWKVVLGRWARKQVWARECA